MRKKVFMAILATAAFSVSADVFQQQKQTTMGNGYVQPDQQQPSDICTQLAEERRAIDRITEKQIWVPIEQQNANYHRMNWLKAQMSARRCSY